MGATLWCLNSISSGERFPAVLTPSVFPRKWVSRCCHLLDCSGKTPPPRGAVRHQRRRAHPGGWEVRHRRRTPRCDRPGAGGVPDCGRFGRNAWHLDQHLDQAFCLSSHWCMSAVERLAGERHAKRARSTGVLHADSWLASPPLNQHCLPALESGIVSNIDRESGTRLRCLLKQDIPDADIKLAW